MAGLRRTADDADDNVDIFNRAINLEDEESDFESEQNNDANENSPERIATETTSTTLITNFDQQPKYALLIVPPQSTTVTTSASTNANAAALQAGQIRLLKREPNTKFTSFITIKQPANANLEVKEAISLSKESPKNHEKDVDNQKSVKQNQRQPKDRAECNAENNRHNYHYKPSRSYNRGRFRQFNSRGFQNNNHNNNSNNNKRTDKGPEKQQPAFYFHHERRCSEPDEEKYISRQFVFHADEEEEKQLQFAKTQKNNLWSNSRNNKDKWSHDGYEQLTQAEFNNKDQIHTGFKNYRSRYRRTTRGERYSRHDMR